MEKRKHYEISDKELNDIYSSGREATISFIKFLVERINLLEGEVNQIKQHLSKDSHNSNKPPSSDSPGKKKLKNQRKRSTKKMAISQFPPGNLPEFSIHRAAGYVDNSRSWPLSGNATGVAHISTAV